MIEQKPQFLTVGSGSTQRRLAVLARAGNSPAIIWLGGFRSDMRATKASYLDEWGARNNRAVIRFDYTAHGESEGDFENATIGLWLEDTLAVIAAFGGEKPVLVGSSMGGWLALLATKMLRGQEQKPGGLVLIAPAVDFTEKLMWDLMPEDERTTLLTTGKWMRHSQYAPEPYPVTLKLIEEGRNHVLMGKPFHAGIPIHILQGTDDPDVPLQHVLGFAEHLAQDDVVTTLIKGGDHRLSRPQDLEALGRAVEAVMLP